MYVVADDKYAPDGLKMISQYPFGDKTQCVAWLTVK